MSAALVLPASAKASFQAKPSRATRSRSSAVAIAFQASDLSGGPTSTLGRTPGGSLVLAVSQPPSAAARATVVRIKELSRTEKTCPSLPNNLTVVPTGFNQCAAH